MEYNKEYYDNYESQLTQALLGLCSSKGFLDRQLLEVEELDEAWATMAPEYMADAVPEIKDYPTVAIAWAAYIGMGMAAAWDGAWDEFKGREDLYKIFKDPRGFDELDEYVAQEMLGMDLNSDEFKRTEDLMRSCSQTALTMIRNEQIEPQSIAAFYIFASTARVMFRIGVAVELRRLGYSYRKVEVDMPQTNGGGSGVVS